MIRLSIALMMVLVLGTGCRSSREATGDDAETGVPLLPSQSVRIFVGSDDRGVTPQTLYIFRDRGEYEVTLRRGQAVVRKFQLERTRQHSPERFDAEFDVTRQTDTMGNPVFTVAHLSSDNDTTYVIPYFEYPITIEDPHYALTLHVQNQ